MVLGVFVDDFLLSGTSSSLMGEVKANVVNTFQDEEYGSCQMGSRYAADADGVDDCTRSGPVPA